jgi:hypothetical protein
MRRISVLDYDSGGLLSCSLLGTGPDDFPLSAFANLFVTLKSIGGRLGHGFLAPQKATVRRTNAGRFPRGRRPEGQRPSTYNHVVTGEKAFPITS